MTTATVTSKGQITIPATSGSRSRSSQAIGWSSWRLTPAGFVAATVSVTELKGMFGKPARSVSIEEMNKAIAARGKAAR